MRSVRYTIEEIKSIILDKKSGMRAKAIAKKNGRTATAIASLCSEYNLYSNRGTCGRTLLDKNFAEVNKLLGYTPSTPPLPAPVEQPQETPSTNGHIQPIVGHFAAFKKAQELWEEAQINFIQAEVAYRVHEEKEKLIKAEETIKRLQIENDEYQKAFLVAQNSNWIDTLKKRLSNGGQI